MVQGWPGTLMHQCEALTNDRLARSRKPSGLGFRQACDVPAQANIAWLPTVPDAASSTRW